MDEIRNKNVKLRNQIRRKHIEAYFDLIRTRFAQQDQRNESEVEINAEMQRLVQSKDVQAIYNGFVKNQTKDKIKALSKQSLANLFRLLIDHLAIKESALLLKEVIQIHFHSLFSKCQQNLNNREIVPLLYRYIVECANLLSPPNASSYSIRSALDAYLGCLLQIIMNEEEQGQFINLFNEVSRNQLTKQLLFRIQYLCQVPHYLSVLCLLQLSSSQVSNDPLCREFICNNPQIFRSLLMQLNPKNLALSSLLIVNSFTSLFINHKQVLISFLTLYLQKIQIVYTALQSSQLFSKLFIFYDMLENIVLMCQSLSSEVLTPHLGEMMTKAAFWGFAQQLLRIQTQNIRGQLYTVIKHTVKNILVNSASLQSYISYNMVSYVVQGLQSKYPEILSENLDILLLILHYTLGKQGEERRFIEQLQECGVSTSLESLEYFNNAGIVQKASKANHLIEQCRKANKMMQEQI